MGKIQSHTGIYSKSTPTGKPEGMQPTIYGAHIATYSQKDAARLYNYLRRNKSPIWGKYNATRPYTAHGSICRRDKYATTEGKTDSRKECSHTGEARTTPKGTEGKPETTGNRHNKPRRKADSPNRRKPHGSHATLKALFQKMINPGKKRARSGQKSKIRVFCPKNKNLDFYGIFNIGGL